MIYSLNEIYEIKNSLSTLSLPKEIFQALQKIEKDIGFRTPPENIRFNNTNTNTSGSNDFVRKPFINSNTTSSSSNTGSFSRNFRNGSGSGSSTNKSNFATRNSGSSSTNHPSDDLSWENVRNFKTTKIEKKEGVEKQMNDIRICLNKISNKNYDTQQELIMNYIIEMENTNKEEFDKNIPTIAQSIFEVASTNKFYSEVYAKLYKTLLSKYPIFMEILNDFLEKYKTSLDEIRTADQNENYDLFCVYNKENDKRKACTIFWMHMMKLEILSISDMIHVMKLVLGKIEENMEITGKLNEVEELTELLFLFLQEGYVFITERPGSGWTNNIETIQKIAKYKIKDKKTFSSRVLFKFMDMISFIEKTKK